MIGDVVGKGGRLVVSRLLPDLLTELSIDFVCAQGENAARGFGITGKTATELLNSGCNIITTGNHIWDNKNAIAFLNDSHFPLIRPLNYAEVAPGEGSFEFENLGIINLSGRVFMPGADCPFTSVSSLLKSGFCKDKPIIVDIHAEASSEKQALAWHLDGKVSAVCGTHTHTPTCDTKILPKGTAFVTDLGMVGAVNSVLGMHKEESVDRFVKGFSDRFHPVESGLMQFNSVLITIDEHTGKATKIERVDRWTTI